MLESMKLFVELADIAVRIRDSDTDWETKYEAIFSDDIVHAIRQTGIAFEYADPDMGCEDDVIAFVAAIEAKAARIRPLLAAL